jgi:hypothetical protein
MVLPVSGNKSHARVRARKQADGNPDRMIISQGFPMPSCKKTRANARRIWAAIGRNTNQLIVLLTALGILLTLLTTIIGSK